MLLRIPYVALGDSLPLRLPSSWFLFAPLLEGKARLEICGIFGSHVVYFGSELGSWMMPDCPLRLFNLKHCFHSPTVGVSKQVSFPLGLSACTSSVSGTQDLPMHFFWNDWTLLWISVLLTSRPSRKESTVHSKRFTKPLFVLVYGI